MVFASRCGNLLCLYRRLSSRYGLRIVVRLCARRLRRICGLRCRILYGLCVTGSCVLLRREHLHLAVLWLRCGNLLRSSV